MKNIMKKVVIIGAGISGLAAGIYARQCGFKTVIYEKHTIPGGECTGWDKKGFHIDGCIHWLTGTNEKDSLYPLWKNVGALDNIKIHNPEEFVTVYDGEKKISIFRDKRRLKEEFNKHSPEDLKTTDNLIYYITEFEKMKMPCDKPFDLMSLPDILKLLKGTRCIRKLKKELDNISSEDFCKKFKNPLIRKALSDIVPGEYDASSLIFTLAAFTSGNGGWPEGGSRALALRMAEKFSEMGGNLILGNGIKRIETDDKKAFEVLLENNEKEDFDYLIPACDISIVFNKLLGGKYEDKKLSFCYRNPELYPLKSCIYIAFGVDYDLREYPQKIVFSSTEYLAGEKTLSDVSLHHYCNEKFAPKGKSIWVSTVMTDEKDYSYWKNLYSDKGEYYRKKMETANNVMKKINERFPELKECIYILDVATPVTYERYCGAYKGAWMSFAPTAKSKRFFHSGKIKKLDNIYMAGQWLMPPGGLPVALVTGRWAVQRIAKKENIKFR